ncbi:MAG TPA: TerC family protein [Verrucomicrobiae bacterium]|nr:TerC family protein [Verrucomicrobiae bacterium]
MSAELLTALLGIIWIDLVLAGDNAIVVGMAAAGLPKEQRTKVIVIGIIAATVLRICFAGTVTILLNIIGLTLAGGILLLWVCWKLWRELRAQSHQASAVHDLEAEFGNVLPTADDPLVRRPAPARIDGRTGQPVKTFTQAVVQIIIADVSMSLDNVLAVGGMAKDHPTWVLVVGLALSVAFMGAAATFIAGLLKRYHWIAYIGLLIILYVALQMIWDGSHEVIDSEIVTGLI